VKRPYRIIFVRLSFWSKDMFWVYVLVNRNAGKHYIGQTNDLTRRLSEHNGQSENPLRFTRKYAGKWELVYSEKYPTRSEAMKREKWLKSGIGRKWIDENIGKASPPKAD
jgi:putative endonuclease